MARGRRQPPGALPGPVGPPGEPILGDDAEAELIELLDYIARDSPKNARLVLDRVSRAIERIGRAPRGAGHVDDDAPEVPRGSVALKTTASGYTIRYVFPFQVEGEACALIVSIRRGSRAALDDPGYVLRWMEERAKRGP